MTAYKTYTENQLFSPEISTTTGYSKLYVNAGKVTNKGIELALGFKQNIGPVDWKTTLLWSLNRNRIDQLLPEYTNEELGVTVHLDRNGCLFVRRCQTAANSRGLYGRCICEYNEN